MNILFLADIVPFPPNTGIKIRTFNVIEQLHNRGENRVYLFCFNHKILIPTADELKRCEDGLKPFCEEVNIFEIPSDANRMTYYARLAASLVQSAPYRVSRYWSTECVAAIRECLARNRIDLVHFDKTEFYAYKEIVGDIPIVCTNHNVESLLMKQRAKYEINLARRLFAFLQYRRTERYERLALKSTTAFVTCTDVDRRYFAEKLGATSRSEVIDNGVDTRKYPRSNAYGSDYVLIIGAQSKEATANFDATWYFIREIWPLIVAAKPEIKLKIVGRDPDQSIIELQEQHRNIEVLGFVSDERELLGAAAALLVPLRVGGGSRLKILTAMSMGRVVISTSIGAEGIDCTNGLDSLCANDPQSFAQHVVHVFSDPERQRSIGSAARRLVENRYDWAIIGRRMRAFYQELVNERSTT